MATATFRELTDAEIFYQRDDQTADQAIALHGIYSTVNIEWEQDLMEIYTLGGDFDLLNMRKRLSIEVNAAIPRNALAVPMMDLGQLGIISFSIPGMPGQHTKAYLHNVNVHRGGFGGWEGYQTINYHFEGVWECFGQGLWVRRRYQFDMADGTFWEKLLTDAEYKSFVTTDTTYIRQFPLDERANYAVELEVRRKLYGLG